MIRGTNNRTNMILALSAGAVALSLAGPLQNATAAEVRAAYTNNQTNMANSLEGMCDAPNLKGAAEVYFGQCPTKAEKLPGECVAAQIEGSPGDTGDYNPDPIIAFFANCDASEAKDKLGIGTMEHAWINVVVSTQLKSSEFA